MQDSMQRQLSDSDNAEGVRKQTVLVSSSMQTAVTPMRIAAELLMRIWPVSCCTCKDRR